MDDCASRSGTRRLFAGAASLLCAALLACLPATAAAATSVGFSGYAWGVKSSPLTGPGPNAFSDSPANVWVDAAGALHMRITHRDGQWQCAEVVLDRSLGYGTYAFDVASPVGALDPNVVLGLFTWDDDPAYNHREIDIEFARWGNAADPTNAQYVVQPYTTASNLKRFWQPATAPSVHSFAWASKSVTFASAAATGQSIASRRYSGKSVPRPGAERTRINLWLQGGVPPVDGSEVEVVLSGFTFTR
jgi:hypothetical protein